MSELFSFESSDLLVVKRGAELLWSPEAKSGPNLQQEQKALDFSPPSCKDNFQRLRCKYQSALSTMNSNIQIKSTKHRRRQSFAISQMLDSVTSIASTPLKMSNADTERLIETMRKSAVKRRMSVQPKSNKKSRAQTLRRVSKNIDEIFASHFADDEVEVASFLTQPTPHHQKQHIEKKKVINLVDRYEDDPVLTLLGGSPVLSPAEHSSPQYAEGSSQNSSHTPKSLSTGNNIVITPEASSSIASESDTSAPAAGTSTSVSKSPKNGMHSGAVRLREQNFNTSASKGPKTPLSKNKTPHMVVSRKPSIPSASKAPSGSAPLTPSRLGTPKTSLRNNCTSPAYYTAPTSQRVGISGTPQRMGMGVGSAMKSAVNNRRLVPSSATKTAMHSVQISVEKMGALMQSMKKNDDNNNYNRNRNAALSVSKSRGCTPSVGNTVQKRIPPRSIAKALEFNECTGYDDNEEEEEREKDGCDLAYEVNPEDSLIMDAVLSLDLTFHDDDEEGEEEEEEEEGEECGEECVYSPMRTDIVTDAYVVSDDEEVVAQTQLKVDAAAEQCEQSRISDKGHHCVDSVAAISTTLVDESNNNDVFPGAQLFEGSDSVAEFSSSTSSDAETDIPEHVTVLKIHDTADDINSANVATADRNAEVLRADLGEEKVEGNSSSSSSSSDALSGYASDSSCSPQIVRVRYSAGSSAARRSLSNTRGRISLGGAAAAADGTSAAASSGEGAEAPPIMFSAPVCKAAVFYAPPHKSSPTRVLPGTLKAAATATPTPRSIAKGAVRVRKSSSRSSPSPSPSSSPSLTPPRALSGMLMKAAAGASKSAFIPRNRNKQMPNSGNYSDSESSDKAPRGVLASTGKLSSHTSATVAKKSLGNISVANLLKRFQAQAHAKAAMMSPVKKTTVKSASSTPTTSSSATKTVIAPSNASSPVKSVHALPSPVPSHDSVPTSPSPAETPSVLSTPCASPLIESMENTVKGSAVKTLASPMPSSTPSVRVTRSSSKTNPSVSSAAKATVPITDGELKSFIGSSSVSTPLAPRSTVTVDASSTAKKQSDNNGDECASLRKAAQDILNDIGSETPPPVPAQVSAAAKKAPKSTAKKAPLEKSVTKESAAIEQETIGNAVVENDENAAESIINAQITASAPVPASILKNTKNRRKSVSTVTRTATKLNICESGDVLGQEQRQEEPLEETTTTKKYSLRSSRKSMLASIPTTQAKASMQNAALAECGGDGPEENTARTLFCENNRIARTPAAPKGRRATVGTLGKTPAGGYTAAKAKRTAQNKKLDELFGNCDELLNMIDATVQ